MRVFEVPSHDFSAFHSSEQRNSLPATAFFRAFLSVLWIRLVGIFFQRIIPPMMWQYSSRLSWKVKRKKHSVAWNVQTGQANRCVRVSSTCEYFIHFRCITDIVPDSYRSEERNDGYKNESGKVSLYQTVEWLVHFSSYSHRSSKTAPCWRCYYRFLFSRPSRCNWVGVGLYLAMKRTTVICAPACCCLLYSGCVLVQCLGWSARDFISKLQTTATPVMVPNTGFENNSEEWIRNSDSANYC